MTGLTACFTCEAGRQCLTTVASVPCPRGTFSVDGQQECSLCEVGTFSLQEASFCSLCPSGFHCSSPSAEPTPCQPGQVSTGGASVCSECAAGFQCPKSNETRSPCLPGTHTTAIAFLTSLQTHIHVYLLPIFITCDHFYQGCVIC